MDIAVETIHPFHIWYHIQKMAAECHLYCHFLSAYKSKLSSQANLLAAANRLLISFQLTTFHQASK